MSDQWLHEYEELKRQAGEIAANITDLRKKRSQNINTSKQNLQIRNGIKDLAVKISQLEDLLQELNQEGMEREHTRRENMLVQMKQHREFLNNQFKLASETNAGSSSSSGFVDSEKESLLNPGNQVNRGRVLGKYTEPLETEFTRKLDNNSLAQYQTEIMQDQDKTLNQLKESAVRQKEIAIAISGELDTHNELLSDIDKKTDKAEDKLKKETKRIMNISQREKQAGALCLIVILIIAAVLLFIFL